MQIKVFHVTTQRKLTTQMRIREHTGDLVPICERCWINENSVWEPESVDEEGGITTRLVSITLPIKLVPGSANDCYICDKITVVGIYVSENELYLEAEASMEKEVENNIEEEE